MPALTAAWRAGPWPAPACSTWPRITSSTSAGLDAGALDGGLDGDRAQGMGGQAGQRAVEGADRRAGGGNDDDVAHGGTSWRAADARTALGYQRLSMPQRGARVTRQAPNFASETTAGARFTHPRYCSCRRAAALRPAAPGRGAMSEAEQPGSAARGERVVIKKYANRRLYNTALQRLRHPRTSLRDGEGRHRLRGL